jgi:hypothetical protein
VAELQERGYEANGFLTIIDAIAALRRKQPRPKAIVLELRGQKLARVELESLRRTGIPIVVMGGQVEFNDPLANEFEWAKRFERPVSIGAVADAIEAIAKQDGIRANEDGKSSPRP